MKNAKAIKHTYSNENSANFPLVVVILLGLIPFMLAIRDGSSTNPGSEEEEESDPPIFELDDLVADTYKTIASGAMTRPCCLAWGNSPDVACFWIGTDGAVWQFYKNDKDYEKPSSLGGVMKGVTCVKRGNHLIELIALGKNSNIWTISHSDGKWQEWKNLKSLDMETPSCGVLDDGETVECFGRETDSTNSAYMFRDGTWVQYRAARGTYKFAYGFACEAYLSSVYCYGIDYNGDLYEAEVTSRSPSWEYRNANGKGTPAVTAYKTERWDVFYLGFDHEIKNKAWDDGSGWFDEEELGFTTEFVPECITSENGVIHCYAVGTDSHLYTSSRDDGHWGDWINLNGSFLESPSCVVVNDDEIACYGRTIKREIVEAVFEV